ncbi:NAD-dependent epimerase/dehydratase family protein [Candidatus Venteria ishoeyi]|uniref:UDP-glucose 4-epimerase n=1 Tax=Candidatus Venteria ishoeyi TaxID=1899563 RepID=A0A1H6FGS6_9GAMM|nr:NAD(P)-dependent oxidoreductase [Candidatus Venteria ishoeyi]SEH08559.1 UDP-glucose 4-epimerase [Candidatus Venteria ishoeyi]
MNNSVCIIFGGTGFIGSHFAQFLISHHLADKIILADLAPPRTCFNFDKNLVQYVKLDVRQPIDSPDIPQSANLIVNLAAIHREPGHEPYEYFETNLLGAEHVCAWADKIGCKQLIFTSSIAPYGATESIKTEQSIPVPISAYGGSKLAAEKIHIGWQKAEPGKKLVIVRPGVVFGPGEGGNVTRLIQAVIHHYFFYMGNRKTHKAGGYVKELINSLFWALERTPVKGGVFLYNFSMQHPPTVEEYVKTTCKVAGIKRFVATMPYPFLLAISHLIEAVASFLSVKQPISPVRIRKLVRSNNIKPEILRQLNYQYLYSLESAMRDWKKERPDEWN